MTNKTIDKMKEDASELLNNSASNRKTTKDEVLAKNISRRHKQTMGLEGMNIIAPRAIWVSLMPSRAERRLTKRRRVRNKSWMTGQTPHQLFESILQSEELIAFGKRVQKSILRINQRRLLSNPE